MTDTIEGRLEIAEAGRVHLPDVLAFVDAGSTQADLPRSAAFALRLAAEEAFMNTVRHGYGGHAGPVRLTMKRAADRVTLTLTDEAPPFDPDEAPRPDLDADLDDRTEGGLGLHLIRQLMDEVHHRAAPDGNVLTLIKHLGEPDEH